MPPLVSCAVELVVDFDMGHLVYNRQPHIDEFLTGVDKVIPNEEREEGVYYALIHKHYPLEPGEIIVATFDGDTHRTSVEKLTSETRHYEPCLWYPYDGKYYAVMFSATKLKGDLRLPERYRDDAGLLHPDYAYAWTEFTDPDARTQSFLRGYRDEDATPIVTCVWWVPEGMAACNPGCFANCYQDSGGTAPHQKGPHEKKPH